MTAAAPIVLGLPFAAQQAASVLGAPAWVELGTPVITGLFALAVLYVKDSIADRRRRSGALDERELLIQRLLQDVDDARSGEAQARKELEAVCRQRDNLQRQLDRRRT